MVILVTTFDHSYTLRRLLDGPRSALHDGLILLSYPEFLGWRKLPRGTYIFADIDRISASDAAAVAHRWDQISAIAPELSCLNHPSDYLPRWPMLERLYETGQNTYKARRLDGDLSDLEFPVFVRAADGHQGAVADPVDNEEGLQRLAEELTRDGSATRAQFWAVEFIDVRNEMGLFEKYSAFRIAEKLFAHDLSMSKHWVCKGEEEAWGDDEAVARDCAYQKANPHRDQLMPIFEMSGVQYGRVDYALSQGRLVIFEINTNPYVAESATEGEQWAQSMEHILDNYIDGMRCLGLDPSRPAVIDLGKGSDERVLAGSRWRRVARSGLKRLGRLQWENDVSRWAARLRRSVNDQCAR